MNTIVELLPLGLILQSAYVVTLWGCEKYDGLSGGRRSLHEKLPFALEYLAKHHTRTAPQENTSDSLRNFLRGISPRRRLRWRERVIGRLIH